MTLGKRLKELRAEKNYSLRELAKIIGNISASYISDIENDRYEPSLKKLKSIAKGLNVPTAYLLDLYDQNGTNTPDKFKILENKESYSIEEEFEELPILGYIAAGNPIFAEEHIEGYKKVPKRDALGGECFLLKVQGDSMINAGIYDGDYVLIRKQPNCETGEIAVVIVDGDNATLKRIYHNGKSLLLQPENSAYKPTVVDNEEVRIIGKAIEVIHKLS